MIWENSIIEVIGLIFLISILIFIIVTQTRSKDKSIDTPKSITISVSDPIVITRTTTGKVFPPIKVTDKGDVILNPSAPFELTLQNATFDIAMQIREILDSADFEKEEKIVELFAKHNLKVKEIEEYKDKYKKVYISKIEDLKKNSKEWESASEMDKEDLLVDFREIALKEIYEKADCDLITLFENEPKDITMDDKLIEEFGFDNILTYMRFADDLDKVRIIPNNNPNRKKFEKLANVGLAIRGKSIPNEQILSTLTLKELNEIIATQNKDKQFKRKQQAIEYILQIPNIDEALSQKISYREIFKLNPLPPNYSHINIEELSNAWDYIYEVVYLLMR